MVVVLIKVRPQLCESNKEKEDQKKKSYIGSLFKASR